MLLNCHIFDIVQLYHSYVQVCSGQQLCARTAGSLRVGMRVSLKFQREPPE